MFCFACSYLACFFFCSYLTTLLSSGYLYILLATLRYIFLSSLSLALAPYFHSTEVAPQYLYNVFRVGALRSPIKYMPLVLLHSRSSFSTFPSFHSTFPSFHSTFQSFHSTFQYLLQGGRHFHFSNVCLCRRKWRWFGMFGEVSGLFVDRKAFQLAASSFVCEGASASSHSSNSKSIHRQFLRTLVT